MKPIEFLEQTGLLLKPHGMTEKQCKSLPIHFTGEKYISCWKMSFKERIRALLFGNVWLHVRGKITQPPVSLICAKTVFDKDKMLRQESDNIEKLRTLLKETEA